MREILIEISWIVHLHFKDLKTLPDFDLKSEKVFSSRSVLPPKPKIRHRSFISKEFNLGGGGLHCTEVA